MKRFTCFVFLVWAIMPAYSQDTLKINLQRADSLFANNNLMLLAAEYGIEATKAMEIHAKLYPNPVFTFDFNVYDPQNNRAFHIGETGQKQFNLEQLILIGGKRKTEIDIAKKNTELAALNFSELLRNLKYELHSSFYVINQQLQTIHLYEDQMSLLDSLIQSYEVQVNKGNIPVKELVRLKSVYLKINNDRSELITQNLEEMQKMRILLHDPSYFVPVIDTNVYANFIKPIPKETLLNAAMTNRTDLKISETELQVSLLEIRHQKQMAVPDITLGFSYDQRGGAFNNQFNSAITLPLPLWNHNRGLIKYAKSQSQVADMYFQIKKEEIQYEINEAYQNLLFSITEYEKSRQIYNDDFNLVYKGITENFTKQNVTIIEFVDFIESYNESVAEIERIKTKLALAAEKINHVTSTNQY